MIYLTLLRNTVQNILLHVHGYCKNVSITCGAFCVTNGWQVKFKLCPINISSIKYVRCFVIPWTVLKCPQCLAPYCFQQIFNASRSGFQGKFHDFENFGVSQWWRHSGYDGSVFTNIWAWTCFKNSGDIALACCSAQETLNTCLLTLKLPWIARTTQNSFENLMKIREILDNSHVKH